MKRIVPLFVLVGLTAVLVPVLAVFAQSSSTSPSKSSHPVASRCASCEEACKSVAGVKGKPTAASSVNDKVIQELIGILKETQSQETFIITAMVLGRMGPDAKRAIPDIIRNAERLEMLKDLGNDPSNAKHENAEGVMAAIEMILDPKGGGGVSVKRSYAPAATYYYGAGAYTPAPSYPAPPAPACYPCPVAPPAASYGTPVPSVIGSPAPTPIPNSATPAKPAKSAVTPSKSTPSTPGGKVSKPPVEPVPSSSAPIPY